MSEVIERWRDEFLRLALRGGDEPPLMASALALSRLLQRGDLWEAYEHRLAELESAARVRCHGTASEDWGDAAGALFDLLDEEGFVGNVEDYDAVENSFIDRVLEDRMGIPISLSLLAIHLGETVGIPARGHRLSRGTSSSAWASRPARQ